MEFAPTGHAAAPRRRCPVLILNYNGWEDSFAGLEQMRGHVDDLWLIDNGSPVNRLDEARARFPEVRIVALPRNVGWGDGYNIPIATAIAEGHDTVYVLNNDAVLREGALERALETLASDPRIAVVGSAMMDHGGTRAFFDGDWHWDHDPTRLKPLRDDVRDVRSIHGGGFALSLAAYREIGPFEAAYFLYHEEVDWSLRAAKAGWRVVVDCRSRVDHDGGGSNSGFNRDYYIARNRFLAMKRGIHLRDREETRLSIAEYEFMNCLGRPLPQRLAITDGVLDGLAGRFGPRGRSWPRAVTVPFAKAMPLLFRAKRKAGHLLGRGAG